MASNKIFNILNNISTLSDKDDITKEFTLEQYKTLKTPF